MQAESASGIDWRDAAAYAPLLDADRSLFAWEWLRRDALYRAAAEASLSKAGSGSREHAAAACFGLVAFEPSHLRVPDARPLWRSDMHPFVLTVDRGTSDCRADAFDLGALGALATVASAGAAEHLLLSDGLRSIRLDGAAGTFCKGPFCPRYVLRGLAAAEPPLLTLRRFLALCRTGGFARSLHRREVRAKRWVMLLRAWDALQAGADQRTIADMLLSPSVREPRWRARDSSVRSQAQRLVRSARQLAGGSYRSLLA